LPGILAGAVNSKSKTHNKSRSPESEVSFLRKAVRKYSRVMPKSPAGPGDDAAVMGRHLHTADMLVEGVHFLSGEPPFLLGRKALAVNLSDIAAMGGVPGSCLLSIGLPPDSGSVGSQFLDGFASMAMENDVAWVGGDTVASPAGMVISVAVTGEKTGSPLLRKGARAGDGIYVTGPLGSSAIGRSLLNSGVAVRQPSIRARKKWIGLPPHAAALRMQPLISQTRTRGLSGGRFGAPDARKRGDGKTGTEAGRTSIAIQPATSPLNPTAMAELIAVHLDPNPRLGAGQFLSRRKIASAGMDISDGLSMDLARLCDASGVGALVMSESIPISHAARSWAERSRTDVLDLALHGGEDYELLFTVPRAAEKKLKTWDSEEGTGPILIGRVKPKAHGLKLMDPRGRTRKLKPGGYDAFRADRVGGRRRGD
jgi:thiamine-monophosphate kinase